MVSGTLKLLSLVVVATCVGCAVSNPDAFRDTPTAKLCNDYMKYPSLNVYQGARANELARRGEDCSRFGDVAAGQQRANAQLQGLANSLSRPPQALPAAGAPVTKTYIINGKTMTCTTVNIVTNCH